MKFNKTHIVLIALLLILIAFFVFKQKKDMPDDKVTEKTSITTPAKAALTITTVKPEHNMMRQSISANGSIAPWQEAIIGAEVNGLQLNQVFVNVGDIVKKGQVLAEFTATTTLADIAQAEASLAEAKANAIEAAGNADRARSIQDTGALSMQQIQQFIAQEAATKARVEATAANLLTLQIRLKQTKVLAPDHGVISARVATVGSVVSTGQELFRLIRQGRLEWRAELTSSEIGKIKQGMDAYLTMPDGEKINAKVRMVSPMVDAQTRNAMVYVDLPANAHIKSGMFARGSFELGETQSVTLPASALVLRDGFAYLMQVDKNSKVRQIKVEVGKRVGDKVEVMGLENSMDENFVATGGAFLADGDVVSVVTANTSLEKKN